MTTDIILLRHGTTAWNDDGRIQGWTDVELGEEGRHEATDVAEAIAASHDVSRVVASPLRRAVETADVVADRTDTLPVVTDSGWRERSFGALEGERAGVVFDAYPEIHPKSEAFSPVEAPPGGESASAVVGRVRECWRALVQQCRGDSGVVVVVTHETPLRVVAGLVDGENPVTALRHHSFDPATVLAVEGVAADRDAEWREFDADIVGGE